jgi:hypothetical protein
VPKGRKKDKVGAVAMKEVMLKRGKVVRSAETR